MNFNQKIKSLSNEHLVPYKRSGVRARPLNATFNNILAISWWSVVLVEETGVPRENHRPVKCH
jgi:hypothetical protein